MIFGFLMFLLRKINDYDYDNTNYIYEFDKLTYEDE